MAEAARDLDRFVDAQRRAYDGALAELMAGRKAGHWIWFIFPQLAGLGSSPMARLYSIESPDEARDFLGHPLLGARLRECCLALLRHAGRPVSAILGEIDSIKLRSSMTLFETVAVPGDPFARVLEAFFAGRSDPLTLRMLGHDVAPEPTHSLQGD